MVPDEALGALTLEAFLRGDGGNTEVKISIEGQAGSLLVLIKMRVRIMEHSGAVGAGHNMEFKARLAVVRNA